MSTTRDQIIEKTCDLLELQGYHATGLNQIIRESGTPKGSLYHHFPGGKEALAAEAIQRVGQIVLARIQANLSAIDDAAEAVETFILFVAENVERSGYKAGGPITTVALETAATNDRLREVCHHIYQQWRGAFVDRLEDAGISKSRAIQLSAVIVAALEGGIILARTDQSKQPLVYVAVELRSLVASAI